jgi:tetratricopeptide (TPR) repeat protein
MAIRGSLKEASLPDVLQLLSMGKKTGCLSVSHRSNFGSIFFAAGRISYATIVNRRDRLGDMLVKTSVISQEELDAAIQAQSRQRDRRLGEILVAQGAISREQLHQCIRVQIEEAVYFLFTWAQGTFNFEPDVLPEAQDMLVSISPESLLLEGARRVDEWELIEKKVPSFDIVFEVDRSRLMAAEVELTEEQRAVLELVDGFRDVQQIIDESGFVEFEAGKALYGLLSAGFIIRVGVSARTQAPSASDVARVTEHRNLGIAFYKAGMMDEALRELRRVLELRADDAGAQELMGLLLARREQWAEAEAALAGVAAGPSAAYTVFHNLAVVLEQQGRHDEAQANLDEAMRRGGHRDARVLTSIGIVRLARGDVGGAVEALTSARDRMGETRPPAAWYHFAGLTAALVGDLERSSAILQEGAARYPLAGALANNLAVVLDRRGMPSTARSTLEQALRESAGIGQLFKNLGDLHYRAGEFVDAMDAYLRASTVAPDLGGDLYLKLGNLHLRNDARDEAVRCWERALALDPENEIIRMNLETVNRVLG